MAGLKFDITGESISLFILLLLFCSFMLCFSELRETENSLSTIRVCFFV